MAITSFFVIAGPVVDISNPAVLSPINQNKYIAKIELNTGKELLDLINRAQEWSVANTSNVKPISFVLHGTEADALLRSNYQDNTLLVDLAKQLSEDNVIEIRVCKTWMVFKGYDQADFADFVGEVKYAPSEIEKLLSKEGYTYF